jgi:macrolide-specific efflux system membrane fusion protein
MSKQRISMIAVVLLVLVAAGGLYGYFTRAPEPEFREVAVTRGDLEVTITSTAVVQPRNRLEIKPPIAGRIEDVQVQEGNATAKGQILAWMSSTERAALLDAARARGPEEVKRWEELYRATPILAPINGTIIARNVEPGQTVTAQDAVLVMSDRLTVKAQVDETDIAQVRLGQKAVVTIDAYADQPFEGKVSEIAYEAKTVNNVTTYEVDVLPVKAPAFLRSGMTATVVFHAAQRRGVLLVPAEAVRSREGRAFVLVAGSGKEKPAERELVTGLSDGKRVEAVSGVTEGDRLLVARLKVEPARGATNPLSPFGRRRN